MYKTTVKIGGMACGMCEAHINDAIRNAFEIKKISTSHSKGESVIISGEKPDIEKLKETISAAGYDFISAESEKYEKKGFLSGIFGG